MKLAIITKIILLGILLVNISSKNHHKNKSHSKQVTNFFADNAQHYAPFARLAYCPKPEISNLNCSFCGAFSENYATFFIHSVMKEFNRLFQFVIVYSDLKREIIISFSGPTTEHGNYFTSIYESGFVTIPELNNIRIEREYWDIYSQNMRDILNEKIQKVLQSNRHDYTVIFIGHSFGGSLATLSAYDLVVHNILIKTEQSPLVYTYGPLSMGDQDFAEKVNKVVKVVKILRKDDHVTRMPNCIYVNGRYRCYNNHRGLIARRPLVRGYYAGYRGHLARSYPRNYGYRGSYANHHVQKSIPSRAVHSTPHVQHSAPASVGHRAAQSANHRMPVNRGFARSTPRFKSVSAKKTTDPIVRGTTFIGNSLVHTHQSMFQSRPYGTEIYYNGSNFSHPMHTPLINGIPSWQRNYALPSTFSPDAHRYYYNMNLELC